MTDPSSYPNAGTLHRERMAFERDFAQLPNVWLRDKRISFRARGVLAHLMSHDVGYSVSLPGLVAASMGEGRDAVRVAVTELERSGYLHRVKERKRGRFVGTKWILQDPFAVSQSRMQPTLWPVDNEPSTGDGIPGPGNPSNGGIPGPGNPTTIEDQVKNTSSTSVSNEPLGSPVDNFGRVSWDDDRCPGNWRDGRHEIGEHGMCRHCQARPHTQVRAS